MCVSSNVYLSISIPPKVFQKAFFLPYSRPWHDGKYCRAVHKKRTADVRVLKCLSFYFHSAKSLSKSIFSAIQSSMARWKVLQGSS